MKRILPDFVPQAQEPGTVKKRGARLKLAAYGCKACRMHGAHKSRNVLRGKDHPRFKNREETDLARSSRSEGSLMLRRLEEIGWHIQMFNQNATKIRGRKPAGYTKLDLKNPADLRIAIIQSTLPSKNKSQPPNSLCE